MACTEGSVPHVDMLQKVKLLEAELRQQKIQLVCSPIHMECLIRSPWGHHYVPYFAFPFRNKITNSCNRLEQPVLNYSSFLQAGNKPSKFMLFLNLPSLLFLIL
jgi:hypothetical protein